MSDDGWCRDNAHLRARSSLRRPQAGSPASSPPQTPTPRRRRRFGPNALTPPKKAGFWAKLWAQLNNVLIFILLAAAVVTAGLQEWIETGLIVGVVTINVIIGLVQEGKAEKAAEAIKAMLSSTGGCPLGGSVCVRGGGGGG